MSTAAAAVPDLPSVQLNRTAFLLFAIVFCVSAGIPVSGVAGRYGMFSLVPAVCLTGILITTWIVRLLTWTRTRRHQQVQITLVAAVAGAAFSPFVIGFEWSGAGHPWPSSDAQYVALTLVRCLVSGGIVGFAAFRILLWTQLSTDSASAKHKH